MIITVTNIGAFITDTVQWVTVMEVMSAKEAFHEAIQTDSYAEYELETGDIVITDWEGDGSFYPYIIPQNDRTDENMEKASEVFSEELDITVRNEAYDETNDAWHIDANKP